MQHGGFKVCTLLGVLALAGCDSGSGGSEADAGSGGIASVGDTQTGSDTATDSDSQTTTASASNSGSTSTTGPDPSASVSQSGSSGSAESTTGDAADSSDSSDADADSDSDSTTGETVEECTNEGRQVVEFSYIWVANSSEGTISKIDTVTGVEEGRYITRPDGAGNPSRTSVNRFGDVAVANRSGGVTKVYADPEDCLESNGTPGIQTSSGPGDVLPWGEDECVAWYTEIAHDNNRPVAWTNGRLNKETCQYEGVDVFTGYLDSGIAGSIEIAKLDGRTGVVLDEIPMPGTPLNTHGFYGAAVDGEDNAWFSQLQGGQLVRVNAADNTTDVWDVAAHPGYGLTVTQDGYVWICGRDTHRFDPATETWASAQAVAPDAYVHTGGCMGDGNGTLYRGAHGNVLGIDTTTLVTTVTLPASQPGDDHIWGVAVDFDGFVWAIPRNSEHAYRLDPSMPDNPITLTVTGLVDSYTYSDMTGFSLFSVVPG